MATLKSLIMAAIMLAAVLVASGCSVELPEKDSKEARLYSARCGICHAPFHPQTLSLKQWKNVIKKMEKRGETRAATGSRGGPPGGSGVGGGPPPPPPPFPRLYFGRPRPHMRRAAGAE